MKPVYNVNLNGASARKCFHLKKRSNMIRKRSFLWIKQSSTFTIARCTIIWNSKISAILKSFLRNKSIFGSRRGLMRFSQLSTMPCWMQLTKYLKNLKRLRKIHWINRVKFILMILISSSYRMFQRAGSKKTSIHTHPTSWVKNTKRLWRKWVNKLTTRTKMAKRSWRMRYLTCRANTWLIH